MKCSLRRRRRRGPAVGARPPARNNNAAEVPPTRGALPAAADVSIQRAPRADPGGPGQPEPRCLGPAGRQGPGWGGAPGNGLPTRRPKVPPTSAPSPAVESEWSNPVKDRDPEG